MPGRLHALDRCLVDFSCHLVSLDQIRATRKESHHPLYVAPPAAQSAFDTTGTLYSDRLGMQTDFYVIEFQVQVYLALARLRIEYRQQIVKIIIVQTVRW